MWADNLAQVSNHQNKTALGKTALQRPVEKGKRHRASNSVLGFSNH